MDKEFTKDLQKWLSKDTHSEDEIREGAMLLLRLNRNKALYQSIMRRPRRLESTLNYELKKCLNTRLDGMTLQEVQDSAKEIYAELDTAVKEEPADNAEKPDEEKELPAHGGKRADHDQLPENIKAIWTQNAQRWKKIKELYNTCLGIEQPCDLAESLKVLKDTWYKYKSEFARYDAYDPSQKENAASEVSPAQLAKNIANAKSYISKALKKDKLQKMNAAALNANDEKTLENYETLRENVQQRVDLLLDNEQAIGDDIRKKLIDGGVIFQEDAPSETVQPQKEEEK